MNKPKKSLGQNFLIDSNIISKIINTVDIKNSNIIEIGPGTGNLTKEIIKKKPKQLILIEKDESLYLNLVEKYESLNIIKIHNQDILKFNLENELKENTIIFGNLPYNIATKILTNLIKFNVWPPKYKKLVLMFQKEVAEKIIAKFNTPKYGRLSIITGFRLQILDSFNISNNCFYPKPKVDSTLIVFKPININLFELKKISNLEIVTNIMFSNKRKMINKALSKLFKNYNFVSKKLSVNLTFRPSNLEPEKYYELAKFYEIETDSN